jgi:hypothetical protein
MVNFMASFNPFDDPKVRVVTRLKSILSRPALGDGTLITGN